MLPALLDAVVFITLWQCDRLSWRVLTCSAGHLAGAKKLLHSPRLKQVISCVNAASAEEVKITLKCPFLESPLEDRELPNFRVLPEHPISADSSRINALLDCAFPWDTHLGKIRIISLIRHCGWGRENRGATWPLSHMPVLCGCVGLGGIHPLLMCHCRLKQPNEPFCLPSGSSNLKSSNRATFLHGNCSAGETGKR